MEHKRGTIYVDFQSRAKEFEVGDVVFPRGAWPHYSGRAVAVYPGIGMVDVEFANGVKRIPVEDLEQAADGNNDTIPPLVEHNSVPGGRETVITKSAKRVAKAYLKKALYWAARDRQYRPTRSETGGGGYHCPKCPDSIPLRKAIYKRREGQSERLLGCPSCMFLIKVDDILIAGD